MLMADYAMTDQLGKLHVVGGGLQLMNRDHNSGQTAAFALVVTLMFPPEVFQEQYVFEVVLEDDAGSPVPDPVRGDPVRAEPHRRRAQSQPAGVPRRSLPAQTSIVLFFNTGLPLPPGQPLVWRARVDGESQAGVGAAVLRAGSAAGAGAGLRRADRHLERELDPGPAGPAARLAGTQ